jgi:hypothetical protein
MLVIGLRKLGKPGGRGRRGRRLGLGGTCPVCDRALPFARVWMSLPCETEPFVIGRRNVSYPVVDQEPSNTICMNMVKGEMSRSLCAR